MTENTPPGRNERELRRSGDDGDGTERIAAIEESNGGRYAYHKPLATDGKDIGEEVETECNSRYPDSNFVLRSRSWAQRRWLSPCQRCEWDEDTRGCNRDLG